MQGLRFENFCSTFLFSLRFIRITVWNIKPDLFIRRENQGYRGTTWYAVTSLAPYMSFNINNHSLGGAIICGKAILYAYQSIKCMHGEAQHNRASIGLMNALSPFSMFENQLHVRCKMLNAAYIYTYIYIYTWIYLKHQMAYEAFYHHVGLDTNAIPKHSLFYDELWFLEIKLFEHWL